MKYQYPPIIEGQYWNLMQKIGSALEIDPTLVYFKTNANKFILVCFTDNRTLTPEQKILLDKIMGQSTPCSPLTGVAGKTIYKVPDLFNMRQWFITQFGITPLIWLENGNDDGSGECYIYLEFPRALTTNEKKTIIGIYASSIKEV